MANKKSDVKSKLEFIKVLEDRGFKAEVVSAPADIKAEKDGVTWFFEIKMTKRKDDYFGAATLTEWRQALADPDHFRFVVAKTNDEESEFEFIEYSPDEFLEFSTIPPFKIFFNISFDEKKVKRSGKKASRVAKMSKDNFRILDEAFKSLKLGD